MSNANRLKISLTSSDTSIWMNPDQVLPIISNQFEVRLKTWFVLIWIDPSDLTEMNRIDF